jgi:hypothetical protein
MPDNTNTVQITLSFKDDGSVVIDQVKSKTNDLGKITEDASRKGTAGLKQLKTGWLELAAGVTAGYFAIKKCFDTVNNFVAIAAEAEEIEKRLAFQTETWGYSFQKIKPFIDAFANSIQATTRFSSEMARQALGQMMQYGSDIEENMKIARLAMDMSTQTGMDLNSTIRNLGMAMNGNVEILEKWIPQLKDLKLKLGENASEAEKWAYTQGILNKMFSGAALADLKTYAGQVTQFKNSWSDLKKEIGKEVMPVLQDTFEWLTKILQQMEKQRNLQKEAGLSFWSPGHVPGMPYTTPKEIIPDYEAIAEAQRKAAEHAARLREEQEALAASMKRDPERWKKWVEEFDWIGQAYEKLGIKSEATLRKEAEDALKYAEVVKQAFKKKEASARDYINALNVAKEAMKNLTGEDMTDKLVKNEEEYQKRIRAISFDDPERQKKVQEAINDFFKIRKEIEKMKIPVHVDVAPAEREYQEFIQKLKAQGINIPVTISGTGSSTIPAGGGITWEDYVKGNTSFYEQGSASARNADVFSSMGDSIDKISQKIRDAEVHGFTIDVYLSGSSKKPFSEKIKEMIDEFGGLEKALSSIEAEINIAEYTAEYQKLEARLKQVERILPDLSNISVGFGGGWTSYQSSFVQDIKDTTAELKSQMQILTMKMNYEMLKTYGSYQTGIHYVPETGPYILHEGERVIPRNVSSNIILNNYISGANDPRKIGDSLVQILKYNLNLELKDLLKR